MARVYRVTLKSHMADGTLIEPSLHYQTDVPTAGSEPDPSDIAAGVGTLLSTAWRNTLHSACTFDDVVATEQVLPPDIGAVGVFHSGTPGTGMGSAVDLPHELVPLVSIHTDTASRSARGHIFLGSPGNRTLVLALKWDTTGAQAFYDAFAALLDNSFDLGSVFPTHVNPVIYSRTRHKRGQTPYTFRVTGAIAKQHPTWLRSRASSP